MVNRYMWVALGTKCSTHIPITVYQRMNILENSKYWEKYFNDLISASNFCAKRVMHLILGRWECHKHTHTHTPAVFPKSITIQTETNGPIPDRLPLRDFALTVRSFHANVLQKCPGSQKALAGHGHVVYDVVWCAENISKFDSKQLTVKDWMIGTGQTAPESIPTNVCIHGKYKYILVLKLCTRKQLTKKPIKTYHLRW